MFITCVCLCLVLLSVKYPLFLIFLLGIFIYFILKKNKLGIIVCSVSVLLGILLVFINYIRDGSFVNGIGIISDRKDNYYIFTTLKGNFYVYAKNHYYEIGDILKVEGIISEIKDTSLEGEFSFREYLYGQNVDYQLYISDYQVIFDNPFSRIGFITNFYEKLNDEGKYIIGNIFFNKSNTTYDDIFNKLGLTYLLSLSNIYIYLLFNIVEAILKFINKKESQNASKYALIFLLPLLFLSRYKLVFIKTFLILCNKYFFNKKFNNSDIVSILLIIVLFFNPRYVFSMSFIYIFVLYFIRQYIYHALRGFEGIDKTLLNIIVFSLLYGGLNIVFNGTYNLLTPLYQLFAVFLFELIFIITFLSFIISPLIYVCNFLSTIYIKLFSLLTTFSFSLYFNQVIIMIVFVFILLLIFCYLSEIQLIKAAKIVVSITYLVIGLFASPLDAVSSSYIIFINVGQGDSILIHNHQTDILIDTGGSIYKDIGKDVLIPFLKKQHIYELDYVFISHDDFDHRGAFDTLYENFYIKDYIIGSEFDYIDIDGLTFYNLNIYDRGKLNNDQSSVLYFNFLNMDFLLMGDASSIIEKKIISDNPYLTTDILKLGHHGSSSSSSLEFLEKIKPKEAIISCGVNNKYNHPHDIVLKRLEAFDIKIRRTDLEGSIKYKKSI